MLPSAVELTESSIDSTPVIELLETYEVYLTTIVIRSGDEEPVQTYNLPQWLSDDCKGSLDGIQGLVIDEIPSSSGIEGGCGIWWEANDCATGASYHFDLRLSSKSS